MKMIQTVKMIILSSVIFAIVFLLILSLTRSWFYPELIPGNLDTTNWREIFSLNTDLPSGFMLSLLTGFVVAFIATSCGFFTSRELANHKNRKTWTFLAYFPFVMSPLVFAVLQNKFFLLFNLSGTFVGVMMAQLFIVYPFAFIFFQSFWTKRINDFTNLAATLGTPANQIFLKVHLQMARPWLAVCFFQCFLISWFDYAFCNTIGLGKVKTLTVVIFRYIFESNPYYAATGCLLIILPPVILLTLNTLFVFRKPA